MPLGLLTLASFYPSSVLVYYGFTLVLRGSLIEIFSRFLCDGAYLAFSSALASNEHIHICLSFEHEHIYRRQEKAVVRVALGLGYLCIIPRNIPTFR